MIAHLLALALVAAAPARFAVVVGNNQPLSPELGVLHFADDDAARISELLLSNGVEVELLSAFDADTQRLYPELVRRSRPPTKKALRETLERLFARMDSDSELYFFFAGHGQVQDNGQGVIHFLDGPLSRSELYRDVVAPSPSRVNHLIIDACNAYFMVASRGEATAEDYRSLVTSFVAQESLERFPNTGVIVSTVGDVEVHEWAKIQAGVFSHQLRSALSGAADADLDGAVDYREVEAFLAAANGKIDDPRARVSVFSRPPEMYRAAPLLTAPPTTPVIEVPQSWTGHFRVEDDRGIRFADFNKTDEVPVTLRVVPRPFYYLRRGDQEMRVEPSANVTLSQSDFEPIALASRGSVQDAFGTELFAVPFGPSFVAGFQNALEGRPSLLSETFEPTRKESRARYTRAAWVGAGLGASLALAFELLSRDAANEFERAAGPPELVLRYEDRANRYRGLALAAGGLALTSALTAGLLTWLDYD